MPGAVQAIFGWSNRYQPTISRFCGVPAQWRLRLSLPRFGAGFFAVVFFERIREDVPVSAEAPNLKVELLEQLIGELQDQREFSRRDPARLCKFVADKISDMDDRS